MQDPWGTLFVVFWMGIMYVVPILGFFIGVGFIEWFSKNFYNKKLLEKFDEK